MCARSDSGCVRLSCRQGFPIFSSSLSLLFPKHSITNQEQYNHHQPAFLLDSPRCPLFYVASFSFESETILPVKRSLPFESRQKLKSLKAFYTFHVLKKHLMMMWMQRMNGDWIVSFIVNQLLWWLNKLWSFLLSWSWPLGIACYSVWNNTSPNDLCVIAALITIRVVKYTFPGLTFGSSLEYNRCRKVNNDRP